jgi:predicted nucleotidyltransferase
VVVFGQATGLREISGKDTIVSLKILKYRKYVNLTEPGMALTGSLSMPILRALDGRSQPASAAQISRTMEFGTPAGIRRALERLSLHGVCERNELGGRTLYSLNYEHVMYPAIRHALDCSNLFVKDLQRKLSKWEIPPLSAVLFGSAARRDGDIESDIDILLVRPFLRSGELQRSWAPQVHDLRSQVQKWTGNHLQAVDWSKKQLRQVEARQEALLEEIEADGIHLYGSSLNDLMARAG